MSHIALTHDTIRATEVLDASVADVWEAYEDTAVRAQWSVPAGEMLVYDADNFTTGGRATYRCGTPGTLQFHAAVEYTLIDPPRLVVYTETLRAADQLLATSLVTWQFEQESAGTRVVVISQVTSYVGRQMIEGNQNGHRIALEQLAARFAARPQR